MEHRGKQWTNRIFKRGGESRVFRLGSYNKYNILAIEINVDALKSEGSKKMEVRKIEGRTLREVTVKIGLERIVSRLKKVDLIYFIFSFIFYFIFELFFYFLFLEQLGLGLIGHAVTSVTI